MCVSYLILSLAKCAEFWRHFQDVVPADCSAEWKRLLREVDRREIKQFRNTFVGHIWDTKLCRPLTNPEIEQAVTTIVDGDEEAFIAWCNNTDGNMYPKTVVSIVEKTRDRIGEEAKLTDQEIARVLGSQ